MTSKWVGIGLVMGMVCLYAAACSPRATPSNPSATALDSIGMDGDSGGAHVHASSQPDDKGYIDGWFEGNDVQLYYTKSYFCDPIPPLSPPPPEPPPCEVGAPPDDAPRPGPIPTIYAIVATPTVLNDPNFNPDTLACRFNTPCLNHPAMIDLSRINGSLTAGPAAHNHILSAHGGGWFHTVNIRVSSVAAWNAIAAAKSLSAVRALQGGDTEHGVPGVISGDTKTNIYFFIASWRNN